jgi:hypothetical protein
MAPCVSVFISLQPTDSVALGRLVVDIDKPWQDFCPSSDIGISPKDIAIKSSFLIKRIFNQSRGTKFQVQLSMFLKSFFSANNSERLDLSASEATTYLLLNSGLHFQRICSEAATRSWLQTVVKYGWPVYMIVGIHTVKNASIVRSNETLNDAGVSVVAPLGTMAAAGVALPVANEVLDTSFDTERLQTREDSSSFVTRDEQVLAVQYRKLRFRMFSSHKLDSPTLERTNIWKVFPANKERYIGQDDDLQDVISVEFEEEVEQLEIQGTFEMLPFHEGTEEVLFVVLERSS